MKVRLQMLCGPHPEYYVSEATYRTMESHVGCGLSKTYAILPVGNVVVDWTKVISIQKLGAVKSEPKRSLFAMPKFGLWG